jgi:PTH1 family peptidyl-tRNA hydrolase
MKIVVGLGNPGEQYKNTRHNIGWLVLDYLLGDVAWLENKKLQALIYTENDYLYVKPQTFMNNSGQAVQKILNYYKLLPKNFGILNKKDADLNEVLIVIQDDLDLNFGEIKMATNSSSAGHRGIQSIIDYLKTKKFTRLRLGIKNELLKVHIPPEKFVTQAFNQEEKIELEKIFAKIKTNYLKKP